MGIRESLLNTITSVGSSDFVRIVTSAGASSKATVQNLFKSFETGLGAKSSLTTSDYVRVVGSDDVAYKQSVTDVASTIIPTLAKAVPNNSDTEAFETIGCFYCSAWVNAPSGTAASGYLIVLPHGSAGGNYRKQIYMPYNNSVDVYVRTKATNWTEWGKMPTRTEVDALKSKIQGSISYKTLSGSESTATVTITGGRASSVIFGTYEVVYFGKHTGAGFSSLSVLVGSASAERYAEIVSGNTKQLTLHGSDRIWWFMLPNTYSMS